MQSWNSENRNSAAENWQEKTSHQRISTVDEKFWNVSLLFKLLVNCKVQV